MTLRRVLIGGGVLLTLVLIAVLDAVLIWNVLIRRGEEEVAEKQQPEKEEEVVEEQQPERGEKVDVVGTVEVGVGESAEITKGIYEGSIVTFNDFQHGFRFPNSTRKPGFGYEWVLANITVTNLSPERVRLDPIHFQLVYDRSYPYNDSLYRYKYIQGARARTPEGLPNAISHGFIEPYGEVTGVVYGEVPKDEHDITLMYNPSAVLPQPPTP